MRRIDILAPGRDQIGARAAIMAALPLDGTRVCYATLALAAGAIEDAGPLVAQLIEAGMVRVEQDGGAILYARTCH